MLFMWFWIDDASQSAKRGVLDGDGGYFIRAVRVIFPFDGKTSPAPSLSLSLSGIFIRDKILRVEQVNRKIV